MKYYDINESTARVAKEINSFSGYTPGSATAGYRATVDSVYEIVSQIETSKPNLYEKALYMADRFAKKYAEYLNAYYRNEASCPSILVCGAGNFPTRKKEKQNSRRDSLMSEYKYLMEYKDRISDLLYKTQPIKANDADAIERLQDKINDLETSKKQMIAINAYYRKNKTMEGYPEDIPEDLQKSIDFMISHGWATNGIFSTANTNAEIKRCKERLETLQTVKERGTTETETDLFTVVENVELMRLQLFFDGKPDEATRDILKHNGFKWSPKNECWQRQLTDNARRSLKFVSEELKKVV